MFFSGLTDGILLSTLSLLLFSGHYLATLLNRRRYAQQQQQTQCASSCS